MWPSSGEAELWELEQLVERVRAPNEAQAAEQATLVADQPAVGDAEAGRLQKFGLDGFRLVVLARLHRHCDSPGFGAPVLHTSDAGRDVRFAIVHLTSTRRDVRLRYSSAAQVIDARRFSWEVADSDIGRGARASRASRDWVIGGAGALAVVLVMFANVLNPEAFVVRHNVARSDSGSPLDLRYLGTLSDDAVPAVADAFARASNRGEETQLRVA
jgi:hypothetical protein